MENGIILDPTNCKSDISTYESFLQGYDWLRITTTAIDEAYKDDRDTYKTQDLSYLNNHSSCNGNHVWNKGTPKEVLGVLYRYTLHMNVKFVMLSGGNI